MTKIERNTNETQITLELTLRGDQPSAIRTPVPFLNHMLNLFARHAGVRLVVDAEGDTDIDAHHTVEDVGISLGMAVREGLGDMTGIARYGDVILPMDEALILCALDLSGRAVLCFDADFPSPRVGDFDLELVEEFFQAFTRHAGATLHIRKLAGRNSHHIAEGCFKAFAHAFRRATEQTGASDALTTKGVL